MLVCTTPASAGIGGWLPAVLVTSLAVTAVEAISPRGTDNFTFPLTSACLSWLWLMTARIH
jgi:dolichol kinase